MTMRQASCSLDHSLLLETLAASDDLLIVQDLDGVCMGLVRDPLTRSLERRYLQATQKLAGHFQVLTNGEHIGRRGVNTLVERAYGLSPDQARAQGLYLPGLAGGGVQLQGRHGVVSHPGVSDAELGFLADVPEKARGFLRGVLSAPDYRLDSAGIEALMAAAVLENRVSPTINTNPFYAHYRDDPARYRQLQREVVGFIARLLDEAAAAGLDDAFFVHYAPNLGRDAAGQERVRLSDGSDAGTTDFQFMLTGALKEVGVLVILNRYYFARTGAYPLGEDFNVRTAPREQQALLRLARDRFAPEYMPRVVGVGDTVTAHRQRSTMMRGGSDRGFLTLVQELGKAFGSGNVVVYVDSSGGEVDRPGVDADLLARRMNDTAIEPWAALEGISDAEDPLRFDFIFPGGHAQYVDFFCALAERSSRCAMPAKAGIQLLPGE